MPHAMRSGLLLLVVLQLVTQTTEGSPVPDDKNNAHSPVGETDGCDRACQMECISVHNKYRANHGSPALVFNQRLADQAQALIKEGLFKHVDRVDFKGGETSAWGLIFPSFTAAIKSWYDEGVQFDYNTGKAKKPSQVVRHFAQVIWKKAHKVGCARGELYGEPWYVVHYDSGPVLASPQIKENIGRPKQDDSHWFRGASPFSLELENPRQI